MLFRYRGSEGMIAWAFHRISGLAIWVFLVLHVFDIWLSGANPKLYGDLLVIYGSAPGRVGCSCIAHWGGGWCSPCGGPARVQCWLGSPWAG